MTLSITQNGLTITPTREKGLAYLGLRELIADSTYWQALVADPDATMAELTAIVTAETASRAAALAQIDIERIDDEEESIDYPSCIIRYATGDEIANRYGPGAYTVSGGFFIEFLTLIPEVYRDLPSLAAIDSCEKFDAIEAELLSPSTLSERLVIDGLQLVRQGALHDEDVNGAMVRVAEYLVRFESAQP